NHAMATAGAPARTAPCRARMAMMAMTLEPTIGTRNDKTVASAAEISNRRPRPKRSDKIDSGTIHSAKAPVAAETVSAATVGVDAGSLTRGGKIAGVEKRPEKIARPKQSRATIARVFLCM